MLNSSDWTKLISLGPDSKSRTGVALTAFSESKEEPSELRMYYDVQGSLDEYIFNEEQILETGKVIAGNSADLNPPKLVSTAYMRSKRILVMQNDADGTLYCHVWDQVNWTRNQQAQLVNAPAQLKFSSLAMDDDQRVYGIELVADSATPVIHELKWDEGDPFSFNYVVQVG